MARGLKGRPHMTRQYLYVIVGAALAVLFGAFTLGFFGGPRATPPGTPQRVAGLRTGP